MLMMTVNLEMDTGNMHWFRMSVMYRISPGRRMNEKSHACVFGKEKTSVNTVEIAEDVFKDYPLALPSIWDRLINIFYTKKVQISHQACVMALLSSQEYLENRKAWDHRRRIWRKTTACFTMSIAVSFLSDSFSPRRSIFLSDRHGRKAVKLW